MERIQNCYRLLHLNRMQKGMWTRVRVQFIIYVLHSMYLWMNFRILMKGGECSRETIVVSRES